MFVLAAEKSRIEVECDFVEGRSKLGDVRPFAQLVVLKPEFSCCVQAHQLGAQTGLEAKL